MIATEGNYTLQEKIFFIVGLESNNLLKKNQQKACGYFNSAVSLSSESRLIKKIYFSL